MDIVTYALCRKIAAGAVTGIKSLTVDGTTLIIETNDGQTIDMVFPTPKDGTSITSLDIDANNHLICILSDHTIIDAGEIPMYIPQKGVDYYTEQDKEELIEEISREIEASIYLELIV